MTDYPIRMKGERHFHPFHLLIDAAQETLQEMSNYQMGSSAFALSTMLLSSLAVEALANSIGSHKVANWSDYESASPITKLRIISSELEIDYKANESLWKEIRELVKFRNQVAHAKPKILKIDKKINEENLHELLNLPPSKIEQEINYENAEKAFKAINQLRSLLCSKLDPEIDSPFFIPH
jgi:ribosomal protein L31E